MTTVAIGALGAGVVLGAIGVALWVARNLRR